MARPKRIIICNNCGEEKNHHALGLCRNCYRQDYYARNHEKFLVYQRKNPERYRENSRRYKLRHPERVRQSQHKFREANKGKRATYYQGWARENLNKKRAIDTRRRARKQNLPDTLTGKDIEAKLSALSCFYCGTDINLTLDHFVPLGNANNQACGTTRANTVIACKSCNSSKGITLPTELLEQLAFM